MIDNFAAYVSKTCISLTYSGQTCAIIKEFTLEINT